MTRRRLGTALLIVGLALLGWTGTVWGAGAIARDRARTAWDAAEARAAVISTREVVERSAARTRLYPGAPVARLTVPAIELNEVVVHGIGRRELNAGPGHMPGSVLPGGEGNSVISAHRDRHFRRLGALQIGDTVLTETHESRAVWVVESRRVVAAGVPALRETDHATLTLTTCWPIRYFGSAPDRLLLTARLVERQQRS